MDDQLEKRLTAVERALTDGDHDLEALATDAAVGDRVGTVESDVETLRERVAELEAATQALRGYVGNVRAVNEEVRERADLALETAEHAQAGTTGSEPTASGGAGAESVGGTDAGSVGNNHTDQRNTGHSAEESTLELTSDRNGDTRGQDSQSADTSCPFCDGDPKRSERDPHRERVTEKPDSRAGDQLRELTDGGRVQTESSAETEPTGLLARIRALL